MSRINRTSSLAQSVAVIALVAAIYIFFLLFAQFGLLQGIRASGHDASAINAVLALMALSGIISSFLTPAVSSRIGYPSTITVGLFLGMSAALLAGFAFSFSTSTLTLLLIVSILTGTGIGLATVALAADFRRLTGTRHIALHAGIGTGLAYFFCNIPTVFQSTPPTNAWISAGVALAGIAAAKLLHPSILREVELADDLESKTVSRKGIALVVIAFFALVWFDSAAFAAVQISPEIKARAWSGTTRLWAVGTAHAAAAIVAGGLLDCGRLKTTLAGAFACLAIGSVMFDSDYAAAAAPVYGMGVSLYSTALAVFAALAPDREGTVAPVWRAVWIFAIAGWVGSAAGVGLAEQSGLLPPWAAPVAAVALCLALLALSTADRSHQPT